MQINQEMDTSTTSKSLGHLCSHPSGRPTTEWENRENEQGGMYLPPIEDLISFKSIGDLFVRYWNLKLLEGWRI
jgi:hypothetical protein